MANYVICPRCELNYIDADEQEYCEVCLKELSGAKTFADDFEEETEEEMELCPICGDNYMRSGEKMCDECKAKSEYEEEPGDDPEDDDAWRSYLDDEDEPEELDLQLSDEDFEDEDFDEEEEEEEESEEEEFEYVSADDYYDYDEDDDDDDEDDDEDF
ncbi:MAG: hypothetical protein IJ506_06825 [Clostridia bacterium]|nr:hypothetical protein [Clostridia bacterium]